VGEIRNVKVKNAGKMPALRLNGSTVEDGSDVWILTR